MKKTLFVLAVLSIAADAPEATVKYRQAVMKTLGAQMTAMSLITKGEVSERERFPLHAQIAASVARDLASLFPAATANVRSSALPAVWQKRSEFESEAKKLERETAKLDTLAHANDFAAATKQLAVVNATCRECHDAFRRQD